MYMHVTKNSCTIHVHAFYHVYLVVILEDAYTEEEGEEKFVLLK